MSDPLDLAQEKAVLRQAIPKAARRASALLLSGELVRAVEEAQEVASLKVKLANIEAKLFDKLRLNALDYWTRECEIKKAALPKQHS